MLGRLLLPEIKELVQAREFRALKEALAQLAPVDLAELISELEEQDLVVAFRLLPKDIATEVFEYLDFPQQQALLSSLKSETLRHLLEDMSPDDRTALLEELPPKAATRFIQMLSPEERRVAQTLLNYPEDSVGRAMTPDYVYLRPQMTAEEALTKIRRIGIDRETVYALYVIDDARHLLGFVGLRRLVTAPLEVLMQELMSDNLVSISAYADQEEAADLLRHYDLLALPVVDRDQKLVGIITFDDVIDIIEEEHNEDVQLQAAVIPDEEKYLDAKPFALVRRRIVWLAILLVAETGGAFVIQRYEDFLTTTIALALFLPVMIATGGNTGTQSAALVIRALATGEVQLRDALRVLMRELLVSFTLALCLGVLAIPLVMLVEPSLVIATTIALGVASIVTLSNLIGTLLPLLLKKFKMDPALMSGPFISTLIDVAGLLIYLELSFRILAP